MFGAEVGHCCGLRESVQGFLTYKKMQPPYNVTVGLCLGS